MGLQRPFAGTPARRCKGRPPVILRPGAHVVRARDPIPLGRCAVRDVASPDRATVVPNDATDPPGDRSSPRMLSVPPGVGRANEASGYRSYEAAAAISRPRRRTGRGDADGGANCRAAAPGPPSERPVDAGGDDELVPPRIGEDDTPVVEPCNGGRREFERRESGRGPLCHERGKLRLQRGGRPECDGRPEPPDRTAPVAHGRIRPRPTAR